MEQAEPIKGPSLLPLWRDLNFVVAAFAAIVSFAGFVVMVPLSVLLKLVLPARQAELVAWPLGYVLVIAFLCWRWWKGRLSPRQVDPARQMRFRLGHVLLAAFNITTVTMFVAGWLVARSLLPPMPDVARMFMGLASLAPMGLLVGLYMVLSARGTSPAFADTAPTPLAVQARVPSAKWPAEAAATGSKPSVLAVLAGLVVSSYVLFMAGVFGALAVASNKELYNILLPVAIGGYGVYVITTLGLLVKRNGAANWVSWAPVVCLLVVTSLSQLVMLLRWSVRG